MSSRVLPRVLTSVLAGTLCGVAVTCGVLVADPVAQARIDRPGLHRTTTAGRAREVLRTWDTARARAWTGGDTTALGALYTPGSVAGARDVAMLQAWTDRGAQVGALTTQVLRLQVLVDDDRRLVLVVTDRVALVEADGTALAGDRSSTRRVVLERTTASDDWRVASVSPARPTRS